MRERQIIRPVVCDDAAGVNAIYNPFIRESAATFEVDEISEPARRAWIEGRMENPRTPVYVAEDEHGRIAGFANAAPFDARPAYETSVKVSVFIGPAHQSQGIGGRLYEALFGHLAGVDVHRAYALIVAPNPASAALHRRFGFEHMTTLDEVGRKFGRYHSVMWFQKRL